ncbi:MAG: hypothetical protein JNJ73_00005, partial [Hyphomonadaceae bacterium]|nr:hypothetical protein [Hyphomonadaceae bacterium]
ETWRVAFKLLPPPSRRGAGARGYFTPSINQRPLAARLEALIRVVLDPARHAKRLARRLEHRARFLAKAIARVFDTPRTDKNPLLRIVEGALHLAWPAKLRFDSG